MSTVRTTQEIESEVATLRDLRAKVRKFTSFGDDNHAAIDAQIEVLSDRMSLDQVYDKYGEEAFIDEDEFDQHLFDCTLLACDWMHGLRSADESSPGESWLELVR